MPKPKVLSRKPEEERNLIIYVNDSLNYFSQAYSKKFKKNYIIKYGRDRKLLKHLLKQIPLVDLKKSMDNFFNSTDKFIMSTDYGINVLSCTINKVYNPHQNVPERRRLS